MDRSDSGFSESHHMKPTQESLVHRSNTAPTRRRKTARTSSELSSSRQSKDIAMQRPSLENQSSDRRRPLESRRKSIASSSETSTKSRSRGYNSKPSSRRTSYTLVDPKRPTRHYRVKSSQTVPTANQEIDDVLALHFRSCSLFQSHTQNSSLPSPTICGHGTDTGFTSVPSNAISAPTMTTPPGVDNINMIMNTNPSKGNEERMTSTEKADTTMHWMSPSTRQREYEKIDKANSGIRGLLRKIIPRCVSGPPPPRFHEDDKSDVGSVRRYRMDLSEDDEVDEKDTSLIRQRSRKLEPTRRKTAHTTTGKKLWGCF